jgi:hypothetical protein
MYYGDEVLIVPPKSTYIFKLGTNKKIKDRHTIGARSLGFHHLPLVGSRFLLLLELTSHLRRNVGLSLFHFHRGTILNAAGNDASAETRRS